MQKRNLGILSVSILFFMIYLFIIYSNYTKNRAYLLEHTKNNQIKLVRAYKEKFDEKLLALKRIVESIGNNLITKERDKEFWIIKESLTNAMKAGSGFTSVYMAYPDNFTISGRPDWFYTKDYVATKRPWYIEAITKGHTTITQPYEGSPGFEGTFYISIVSPLYNESDLQGVIASDIEITSVEEELSKLIPIKDGFAFLMTKDGTIIAKPNQLGLDLNDGAVKKFLTNLANNTIHNTTLSFQNRSFIFTYEPLENSDWLFVSVLDENAIYVTLEDQLMMNFIASFGLFGLGMGGFIFLSLTQKSLQEKHSLLGLFAKSPTWAVLLTDKEGKVSFVNKAFEDIFSLKRKSLYHMYFDDLSPYLHVKKETTYERIKESAPNVLSFTIERLNNSYRVQITPLLKQGREFEGAIITVNDITHEKQLEIKEQEHEQILIQNSKMAALGEMVSAISHQWRQPLSTLLMLISNAEEYVEEENKEKSITYLERSRKTIEHMNDTIKAFRNFYKEDFGQDSFDVTQVINDVILISTPQMQMNGIELTFTCKECTSYMCEGYPSYLKQVLINLIGNAKDALSETIKEKPLFEAEISISLTPQQEGFIISVEDNGKGIKKEHAKKIFEPFFTTKGDHGTGTGLHLCKLLIEGKMGGTITLDSAQNPTRFSIFIRRDHA